MTVSEALEFLIDQRGQFRESSIVPVTPVRQELGHSLRRDRRRIHKLFFIPYHRKKFLQAQAFPKKISVQVITLIALSRLTAMETKQSKRKEKP
jgi:hypothetical protein